MEIESAPTVISNNTLSRRRKVRFAVGTFIFMAVAGIMAAVLVNDRRRHYQYSPAAKDGNIETYSTLEKAVIHGEKANSSSDARPSLSQQGSSAGTTPASSSSSPQGNLLVKHFSLMYCSLTTRPLP